jgi:hypothetical protein
LDDHPEQVDLAYHAALQLPAMSRYAVTTPALERWFKKHNANRSYEDRIKPFNFMCGFQASPLATTGEETFVIGDGSKSPRKTKQPPLRPIAPYSQTSKEAATHAFDRETGKSIPADQLKTYAQALAQYHLRPEAKFENGDYCDSGQHTAATCSRDKSTISARKPIAGKSNSSSASSPVAFVPHPAHRTGHADRPHPALGQDLTPSPTMGRGRAGSGVRAGSARIGARVDSSRPYVA